MSEPVGRAPLAALTASQARFVGRAIARKRLFASLALVGVLAGVGLLGWWLWHATPDEAMGLKYLVVVLILLNARQNLRQARYAGVLERIFGAQDQGSDQDTARPT